MQKGWWGGASKLESYIRFTIRSTDGTSEWSTSCSCNRRLYYPLARRAGSSLDHGAHAVRVCRRGMFGIGRAHMRTRFDRGNVDS